MNFAKFLRTPFLQNTFGEVKSEKLKVFNLKYYDISKIYSVDVFLLVLFLVLSDQFSINSKHIKLSFETQ